MKKVLILCSLPVALILGACSSKGDSGANSTDSSASADTTIAIANPDSEGDTLVFKTETFKEKRGESELLIEYPIEGNPALLQSIREWINEQILGTYKGNLDNAEAFFNYYAARLGNDPEFEEYGGFSRDYFTVEYENDVIVTYDHTSYLYEGGAHGSGGSYGTTFLKSDGSIFTKGCISDYSKLHNLFVDGLKSYFKVSDNSELMECLLSVKTLGALPPPAMNPWIVEDGVVFSYTHYEIAPYSAGTPRFTIPFADIKPYLTEQGLRFLN